VRARAEFIRLQKALAASEQLASVEELGLPANRIGDEGRMP
jgi:hypothetical protein